MIYYNRSSSICCEKMKDKATCFFFADPDRRFDWKEWKKGIFGGYGIKTFSLDEESYNSIWWSFIFSQRFFLLIPSSFAAFLHAAEIHPDYIHQVADKHGRRMLTAERAGIRKERDGRIVCDPYLLEWMRLL